MLTNLARCCNPVQGDEIIGYITVGRGVSIHRKDCRSVLSLPEPRLIAVEWGEVDEESYPVPIVINAYDREGLMRDIGAAVADEHINMSELHIKTSNNIAVFHVTMEVQSAIQLARVLSKIERLPNVMEARRLTS
jgi:GTP pyrophosphokinase